MRHINLEGIVLSRNHIGEADSRVTVFSKENGKTVFVAKGARKINSKFGSHLEPITHGRFTLYKKGDNHTLINLETINGFTEIKKNMLLTFNALIICETLSHAIYENENSQRNLNQTIFELLKLALNKITEDSNSKLTLETFKIKLLDLIGLMPQIGTCFKCEIKFEANKSINLLKNGELNCLDCKTGELEITNQIPFNIIKLANYLKIEDLNSLPNIKINANEKHLLNCFTNFFLFNHAEKDLNTEKLLLSM